MKPCILQLENVGPYRGRHTIDFTRFGDKGLFLITGNTGSGKSTIFDAISVALYGKTAQGLTITHLATEFETPPFTTSICFEFLHQGHYYHIERQARIRPSGPAYSIALDIDHTFVSTDKDQIAYRLQQDIGLTLNQFSQVAMIAQGAFREVLLATSKDRVELLRNIFQTGYYDTLAQLLEQRWRELHSAQRSQYDSLKGLYRALEPSDPTLADRMKTLAKTPQAEAASQVLKDLQEDSAAQTRAAKQLERSYHQTLEAQQRCKHSIACIEERLQLEKEQDILLAHLAEFPSIEQLSKLYTSTNSRLRAALDEIKERQRHAQTILQAYEQLARETQQRTALEHTYQQYVQELETIDHSLQALQEDQELLAYQEGEVERANVERIKTGHELDAVEQSLQQLQNYYEALQTYHTEQRELQQKIAESKEAADQTQQSIDKLQIAYKELDDLDREAQELARQTSVLEAQKTKLDQDQQVLKEHQKTNDTLIAMQGRLQALFKDLAQQEQHRQETHASVLALKQDYYTDSAARLALSLVPHKPCPVCGSTEHPHPAQLTKNCEITQEMLNAAEQQAQQADQAYTTLYKRAADEEAAYRQLVTQLMKALTGTAQLVDLATIADAIHQLQQDIEQHIQDYNQSVQQLNADQKIHDQRIELRQTYERALERTVQHMHEHELQIQHLEASRIRCESQLDTLQRQAAQLIAQTHTSYTATLQTLKAEIAHKRQAQAEMLRQLNRCDKLLNEAQQRQEQHHALSEKIKLYQQRKVQSVEQQHTAQLACANSSTRCDELLKHCQGISQQEARLRYQSCEKDSTRIADVQAMIEHDYHSLTQQRTKLSSRQELVEQRICELSGEQGDLCSYTKQLQELDAQQAEQYEVLEAAKTLVAKNRAVIAQIIPFVNQLEASDDERHLVKQLFELASGTYKTDSERMSLEIYVLRHYFGRMLAAGNKRLNIMSRGQFRFVSHTTSDKRIMGGLELAVYDNYTGKPREVKLLSGGESFMCSLALALGLSDVMQEEAGGVQLDTLWIDEGFGTLDQQSLAQTMKTLLSLVGDNRYVGIISHVAELKETIDKKIIVTKTPLGTQAEVVI